MDKIKTIFLGNNPVTFKTLIENTEVLSVFTKEKKDMKVEELKELAKKNKIPIFYDIDKIKEMNPDLIISSGYHKLITKEILNIFWNKIINIHPSPLPSYRGQHSIQWQIINAENETGVTLHFVNEKFDEGDYVYIRRFKIEDNDTATDVWNKSNKIACELLLDVINEKNKKRFLKSHKQSNSNVSYYGKRCESDSEIDFTKSWADIKNFVRAMTFYNTCAFFYVKDKKIFVKYEKGKLVMFV